MDEQRKPLPTLYRRGRTAMHQHPGVKGRIREQYWPGTLMGLGIFATIGSLVTVVPWTLIDADLLLRTLLVLCFAGNLLPYFRTGRWLGMERLEWFLFNLLAVGPISLCLLLWANFLFHGPSKISDHPVAGTEIHGGFIYYRFDDGHLEEFRFARAMVYAQDRPVGDRVRITEAQGLFGFRVVLNKQPYWSSASAEVDGLLQFKRKTLAHQGRTPRHGAFGPEFHGT